MAEKYFDFDSYMQERNGESFIVRAFGEDHKLPSDIPFDIVLKISREYKEGTDEMDEEQVLEMANTLFGEETFQKWRKKGIGVSGILVMVEKVMEIYMNNASEQSEHLAQQDGGGKSNP